MHTTAKGIGRRRFVDPGALPCEGESPNTEQLAALAALTFRRQTSTFALPTNLSVPVSHRVVQGEDKTLQLARSLAQLGIGSVDLWKASAGNSALYVRDALNEWLVELGAHDLTSHVHLNLVVLDKLDDQLEDTRADNGKLFILVETEDGCGGLFIGKAVDRLEAEAPGLGTAFYAVLASTMNGWMGVYDRKSALYFYDRWKETIEMDMEAEDNPDLTVEEYCEAQGMVMPDGNRGCPPCIRAMQHATRESYKRSMVLLRNHRHGPSADWIEPVLCIAGIRLPANRGLDEQDLQCWDDGPLPNWVLAFSSDDAVTQAFDEESASMNESSHAPTWIDTFDPADAADVKRVLCHARNLLAVNLQLVRLAKYSAHSTSATTQTQPATPEAILMDTHIAISATTSYELREALLIYRTDRSSGRNHGSAFVTRHPVHHAKNKAPEIGAGTTLTQEDLNSLIEALRGAVPTEFLPANVLVRTDRSIVWWTPPSIRPMFYPKGEGKEMTPLSGLRFPQPGLIFRTGGKALEVRAVADLERPLPESPLFRAPYWNVNDRGSVCLGTANVPRDLSVDSLPLWERGFFESEFTHPNGAQRLTAHPGGFVGLWKALAGQTTFPDEYLAGADETLNQFINR